MGSGPRWLLIAALVLLGLGEWVWGIHSAMGRFAHRPATSFVPPASHPLPITGKAHRFSSAEVHAFLASVRQAEVIKDPLQRCLAYPDPPGSHWSPATVKAYCQYYLQSLISFADAQTLIQTGHAADLDRRLAQNLQAQLTRPESHGLLDHTYFSAFDNGSFDVRPTLDAWKRASPSSAFAYAASGSAYVSMASKARGGAYISDTPQSNIDAMNRLLAQADIDLQHAVALNPQVTPAYVAMINAGSMSLGGDYILHAAKRGLAVAPDNYAIYGVLSGAAQPKWGGSLGAMNRVAAQAQAHVKQNPLLAILLSAEPAYRYDVCNCRSSANWAAYPVVFDNVASTALLSSAGYAASENGHSELAVIYLSEVLRFQPKADDARRRRDSNLPGVDESPMALDDANRLIAAAPQNADNYQVRGAVYMALMDTQHAEKDLENALALDVDNIDVLSSLGNLYTNQTHEWDKAWDIADRIIRKYPGSPGGWVMRATIQENQPRAGLSGTYQYFVDHFGSDPGMQWQISHMRELLAKTSQRDPAEQVPKPR
jgi:tetratricopeptide (TPR) repeat protein